MHYEKNKKKGNETLAIADHLYVKICKLTLYNIKLLLKENNILHILNESN